MNENEEELGNGVIVTPVDKTVRLFNPKMFNTQMVEDKSRKGGILCFLYVGEDEFSHELSSQVPPMESLATSPVFVIRHKTASYDQKVTKAIRKPIGNASKIAHGQALRNQQNESYNLTAHEEIFSSLVTDELVVAWANFPLTIAENGNVFYREFTRNNCIELLDSSPQLRFAIDQIGTGRVEDSYSLSSPFIVAPNMTGRTLLEFLSNPKDFGNYLAKAKAKNLEATFQA